MIRVLEGGNMLNPFNCGCICICGICADGIEVMESTIPPEATQNDTQNHLNSVFEKE